MSTWKEIDEAEKALHKRNNGRVEELLCEEREKWSREKQKKENQITIARHDAKRWYLTALRHG